MQHSQSRSINIPAAGQDAIPIAYAGEVPIRALVRNNDVAIFIQVSYELEDMSVGTSSVYTIPPLQSDVFVLAPGQKLYARSGDVSTIVSVAQSEAFPVIHPREG